MTVITPVISRYLCLLIFSCYGQWVWAAVDIPGSKDVVELPRYPLSVIVKYDVQITPEYNLALGRIKKINGVVTPDKHMSLAGKLTRITYQIPAGHQTDEVMRFLQPYIQKNAEVLFACDARDCGSSNDWANQQFGIATLYGLDREQAYMALKFNDASYAAIYLVQRGNRKVYLQVDLIQSKVRQDIETSELISQQWQRGERVYLPAEGWSEKDLEALVIAAKQALSNRPFSKIWLVGHAGGQNPFLILINNGERYVRELKNELVSRGIAENRIHTFAVGPLAPAHADVPEERIEILVE